MVIIVYAAADNGPICSDTGLANFVCATGPAPAPRLWPGTPPEKPRSRARVESRIIELAALSSENHNSLLPFTLTGTKISSLANSNGTDHE